MIAVVTIQKNFYEVNIGYRDDRLIEFEDRCMFPGDVKGLVGLENEQLALVNFIPKFLPFFHFRMTSQSSKPESVPTRYTRADDEWIVGYFSKIIQFQKLVYLFTAQRWLYVTCRSREISGTKETDGQISQ